MQEPSLLPDLTDDQVVARVRAGEVYLFEVVMRRYNRRLYRVARAILGNDAETEDVLQDAYVNAYAHLGDFEGRSQLSTWLTKIAVHEALARKRRSKRQQDLRDPDPEAPTTESFMSPERQANNLELRVFLEKAIDELPKHFRSVFVLRAIEELSVTETSASLGIPEETVKTRLFRARGLLKESLSERVDDALPVLFDFGSRKCDRLVARVLAHIGAATS